jgi:hypothetical protein
VGVAILKVGMMVIRPAKKMLYLTQKARKSVELFEGDGYAVVKI